MEKQEEIKAIKKQMYELQERLNVLEESSGRTRKIYQNYWYINYFNEVEGAVDDCSNFDKAHFELGNYFNTYEEAEKYLRVMLNTRKLRDLALKLNEGQTIDWFDGTQKKYYLAIPHQDYGISFVDMFYNVFTKEQGHIYCLNPDFDKIAIAEIGEQELIELMTYDEV